MVAEKRPTYKKNHILGLLFYIYLSKFCFWLYFLQSSIANSTLACKQFRKFGKASKCSSEVNKIKMSPT